MIIEKIEVFPLKVKKDHVYLGNTSTLDSQYDYYLRPEYRCPYSKNMETLLVKITTKSGLSGWGEALAPVLPDFLQPETTLICSGILDTRLADVTGGLVKAGLEITGIHKKEDWRCVTARRRQNL